MRFRTTVEQEGQSATGLVIPIEVVEALNSGKRIPVQITINDYSYRTTVVRMGGRFLVPLAAVHREAAAVKGGDEVDVDIEVDTAPREVVVPDDLQAALDAEPKAREAYESQSYTHRKEWVRWVEEAKKPETRATRIEKTVAGLLEGKRGR